MVDVGYDLYLPSWSKANQLTVAEQDAWTRYCVYEAFDMTDEYVWHYSDTHNWLTISGMPGNFPAMLQAGRSEQAADAALRVRTILL